MVFLCLVHLCFPGVIAAGNLRNNIYSKKCLFPFIFIRCKSCRIDTWIMSMNGTLTYMHLGFTLTEKYGSRTLKILNLFLTIKFLFGCFSPVIWVSPSWCFNLCNVILYNICIFSFYEKKDCNIIRLHGIVHFFWFPS